MIKFWTDMKNRSWLESTAIILVGALLFTMVAPPFAEANLWSERRKALEEMEKKKEPIQLASLAGLPIHRPSSLTSLAAELSPEAMKEVMSKVQSRPASSLGKRAAKHKSIALPSELVSRIEGYGDIERVYLTNHKHLKLEKGKLQIDFQPSVLGIHQELNSPQVPDTKSQPNSLVILVQDAHGIYGAQKNIAHLVKELTEMGVGLVGVEGSIGRMEGLENWRRYKDKKILMGIAGCLMEKGLLTGVEVAGLASEPVLNCKNKIHDVCLKSHSSLIEFYGVEDKDKYLEQVRSFKETLKINKEVEEWQGKIRKEILNLKEKFYTEELKEIDKYKNRYESSQIQLGEWLEFLNSQNLSFKSQFIIQPQFQSQSHSDSQSQPWQKSQSQTQPNLRKYLSAYRLEKEIDFKKVSEEQKRVLEQLSAKLNKNELMGLLEESVAYRLGKIGYEEFYSGIKGRCDKAGINITPELNKYIKYVVGVEGIDRDQLFVEVKDLEDEVWRKRGLEGSESKNSFKGKLLELIWIDKDYSLLEKAINFKLSPEEWEEYDSRKQELESIAQRIVALIRGEQSESQKLETKNLGKGTSKIGSVNEKENRFSKEMNEVFALARNESIKKVMKSVADFNRLSHERNHIFVEKLLSRSPKISILVAGGYHSRGVEELLRKRNISYITIRPHLNTGEIAKDY
ncbi:MAG: hypothetical protein HYT97_06760, partial [Elusimicrobia bacterium]|nr:hypothetical protein [Elusimicrobiota bacterium]